MHQTALTELTKGRHGIIKDITTNDSIRRRLQDIGFIRGAEVVCIGKSPLGDPTAYSVKGTTVALRYEEASRILIEK